MLFKIFPCIVGKYRIKKTIRGKIIFKSIGYTAFFEEAGFEFHDSTPQKAVDCLKAHIVYAYDAYINNDNLTVEHLRKLEILKNYIERC